MIPVFISSPMNLAVVGDYKIQVIAQDICLTDIFLFINERTGDVSPFISIGTNQDCDNWLTATSIDLKEVGGTVALPRDGFKKTLAAGEELFLRVLLPAEKSCQVTAFCDGFPT